MNMKVELRKVGSEAYAGEEALILGYHDMAMNKTPQVAVAGRILKELHHALERALSVEGERGDVMREDLALAAPTIAVNLLYRIVREACEGRGASTATVLDALAEPVSDLLHTMANTLRDDVAKMKAEAKPCA